MVGVCHFKREFARVQEDGQGSSVKAMKFEAQGVNRARDTDSLYWDDGVYSDVKRLRITHSSEWFYSVQIEYIDRNGKAKWGSANLGGHSCPTREVVLSYPNEYLISIHGYYKLESESDPDHDHGIKSLTFETNTNTWGPYGQEKGIKFSFPIIGAKIVGFHGLMSGRGLHKIGVFVRPITRSMRELEPKPGPEPQQPAPSERFSLGRYGREDGECWVEIFRAIKRLLIYSNDEWIISIQMEYEDENGELVLSKKHGGDGGSLLEVVFKYPDEHLVTIKGSYNNSRGSESIRSLTVVTNEKTYKPFGVQEGRAFSFPTSDRLKVVGIHGRSDLYLNAIGLYVVLI